MMWIILKDHEIRQLLRTGKCLTVRPCKENTQLLKCPYGQTGEQRWVRETFCLESNYDVAVDYDPPFDDHPTRLEKDGSGRIYWEQPHYRASGPDPKLWYEGKSDPAGKWRPPLAMPRWASRLTVENTGTRVVQENGVWGWVNNWKVVK